MESKSVDIVTLRMEQVMENDTGDSLIMVTWTGMDHVQYEDECTSLENARSRAVTVSEHGGHSISITDEDGVEYPF